MDNRKEQLLKLVVENYLETAEPVGSQFLIEIAGLAVSGATVRNEMRDLEEQGFLTHPHTSAGRIPTEKGYAYYIDNIMKIDKPKNTIRAELEGIIKAGGQSAIKEVAKRVAEYVEVSVIVAFSPNSIFYTGISNLFAQPEFRNYAQAVRVSAIFDECEERMQSLYEVANVDIRILLGSKNPLGSACGAVVARIGSKGLFTILGPMRMDYAKAAGIVNYIKAVI